MKLYKFTIVFLCFLIVAVVFTSCNASEGSEDAAIENGTSTNPSSSVENEVLNKIAPWGTGEDWDFHKGWKVHGEFEPLLVNAIEEQNPHYDNLFKAIMETHEQKGYEFLIHVQITAFDLEEAKLQYPTANAKQIDAQELLCWFEAGNVPVKYENGVLHGDLSYGDVEKIIEYGKEAGYQLFFINYGVRPSAVKECLEGKDIFECPSCNNEE